LRRLLGLFFSLGKIVGVMVVIVIELILNNFNVEISYRIILSMTGVFSVLQSLLIFFFGSDTPTEMLEKDDREGAMKIIR
jgi:sugar phosphate permease